MKKLSELNIKIFADGADLNDIKELDKNSFVKGFTTNPSLMKKSGVSDYKKFAKELLGIIKNKSISFEVFADDLVGMEEQAIEISSWGKNACVKIPISNTKGEETNILINELSKRKIMCNITAIFTKKQIINLLSKIEDKNSKLILSVFAGRIADTGVDPKIIMKDIVKITKDFSNIEILWASPREVYNLFEAEECGCHIITMQPDLIKKLSLINKDLDQYSIETVKTFYNDAVKAGYKIN